MNILNKIFGSDEEREIKKLEPIIKQINDLEESFSGFSQEQIRAKTEEFRRKLQEGGSPDSILPEAFALVREASKRTLGLRHFDVQLIGGILLHRGSIAEMKTGEGKTLVATLPTYLNALTGRGVHVVTVNDYLSKRDSSSMGQIYSYLGLSLGVIVGDGSFLYQENTNKTDDQERDQKGSFKVFDEYLKPCSRQDAYNADITYGTNNEFGFDYLRDNIEKEVSRLRQRDYNFAIVDEVDSILIDEARTPLIISAPYGESDNFYRKFADIARKLVKDTDYTVDYKFRTISMTEEGIGKVEKSLGIDNIYTEKGISFVHHLETAVRAEALFNKDKEYVVKDGEVVIVDEFTGRLQPGRRWSEGVHQAVEAKEGLKIQQETRTYASITFQNFFRMYKKLSGMTGTAKTSEEEFRKVYNISVYEIPTNKPVARMDHKDQIFRTEAGKFKAIAKEVKERHLKGQPVLIGTVSIEKNELLSKFLEIEGIPHEVLNAKNHAREGEIIAQAGKFGAVTIATNMAGRGVDIKLGGSPTVIEQYEKVKSVGGLYVLGTERHDARRIDNQLRGRSGRQGDPGETRFFVSLEDHLMRIFANDMVKSMMVKLGLPEEQAIENNLLTKFIEQAQEKIEGFNFDARKHVLEFDDVLNYQRKIFYEKRKRVLAGSLGDVKDFVSNILNNFKEEEREVFENKVNSSPEEFLKTLRFGILEAMDMFWMEHLDTMDYIRSSVNLRAYGQRDPLTEYKKEGLRLFKDMEMAIEDQIVKIIPQVTVNSSLSGPVSNVTNNLILGRQEDKVLPQKSGEQPSGQSSSGVKQTGEFANVGRNDPCPCGSGKKFKKCHGK